MNTYTYTLTIADRDGLVVKELVLNADQIVPLLITMLENQPIAAAVVPEKEEKKTTPAKKKQKEWVGGGFSVKHTCCGSKTKNHKMTCANYGKLSTGKTLTKEQYDELRNHMFDSDFASDEYAQEHGFTKREVNLAIQAVNYAAYLAEER